jgi:hypothetical protein
MFQLVDSFARSENIFRRLSSLMENRVKSTKRMNEADLTLFFSVMGRSGDSSKSETTSFIPWAQAA